MTDLFPDKARMVRSANALLAILSVAPVVYILIAAVVTSGGRGFARNQDIVPLLFVALAGVSVANVALMVLFQLRWRPVAGMSQFAALSRVYLTVSLGGVVSEAHSIYGLVLTLLSGSILYLIGFSLVAWMSLLWVRARFKQNVANIPSA